MLKINCCASQNSLWYRLKKFDQEHGFWHVVHFQKGSWHLMPPRNTIYSAWFIVLILWFVHAVYYFNTTSLGVFGPLLKEDLALSNTRFGILFGTLSVGMMVIQIPAGILCDRFGVRRVMSGGLLVIGISIFAFSLCRSFFLSTSMLFIVGIGTGSCQLSAAKAIMDWIQVKGRGTAMGIKQTGINGGGVIASLLLPVLLFSYSWRSLMWLNSLVVTLFAVLFFLLYRDPLLKIETAHPQRGHCQNTQPPWKNLDFIILTIAGFFMMAVQFSFQTYFILYLNQQLRYSLQLSGSFLALSLGTGALARIGWSSASDYLFKDRKTVLLLIGALGALALSLLSLVTPSSPLWLLYLLSISFGITGFGWNAVWLTLVGELSAEKAIGLGIGVSYFLAKIGSILGPPFFGFLVDASESFMWSWLLLALCMIILTLLLIWRLYRPCFSSRKKPHHSSLPNTP